MNFNIVERNQADVDKETEDLFNEIKPSLDNGSSVYGAVCELMEVSYLHNQTAWYKRLKEYCRDRGYE